MSSNQKDPLVRWLRQPSLWLPILLFASFLIGFTLLFPNVLAYLILGAVFALIGSPVFNVLAKVSIAHRSPGKNLRALLAVLAILLGMAVVGLGLAPLVWQQARVLSEIETEQVLHNLEGPIEEIATELEQSPLGKYLQDSLLHDSSSTKAVPTGAQSTEGLKPKLIVFLNRFLDFASIGNILGSVLGVFSNLLLTLASALFICFFLIRDRDRLLPFLLGLVPKNIRPTIQETLSLSRKLLTSYFLGILLQLSIVMLLEMFGLMLVGVGPGLALTIAVFAGLFNIIPYVGPILGAVIGLGLGLSANLHLDAYHELIPLLLRMGLIFFIVQQIDGFLLQPLIFSKRVNAHPLEIFLIVFIGGSLAGIAGMIVAVPVYTVARVLVKESWKSLTEAYANEEQKS